MQLPGGGQLGFGVFLKRLYQHYDDHAVSDTAAALGYYFIFSLFPFLFFLATLAAFLPLGGSVNTLLDRIRPMLPGQAMDLINQHLTSLIAQPHPRLLTLGLLFTLYSASRGVDAVRKGLNLAYDVKESRPFWRTEALAIGATVGGALLLVVGLAAMVAGGDAGFWLARYFHIEGAYVLTWRWLRWPVTGVAITLAAALGYFYLPNVKQQFKFITPGSIIGTVLWFLSTWGFSVYAGNFGTYNVTYGSIGGVIILMTWFFISGFIFLMGGEMNAILEHASREGKAQGAHAEGEAPPPPEERPSAMPAGAAGSAGAAERAQAGGSQDGPGNGPEGAGSPVGTHVGAHAGPEASEPT